MDKKKLRAKDHDDDDDGDDGVVVVVVVDDVHHRARMLLFEGKNHDEGKDPRHLPENFAN